MSTSPAKGMGSSPEHILQLQKMVQHALAPIGFFDCEGRVLAASEAFASRFGVLLEQLLDQRFFEAFPNLPQQWKEQHAQCVLDGTPADTEDLSRGIRWKARAWYAPSGKIGGTVMAGEEIESTSVNDEWESFTYSVSHDLRAPLRRIDGWNSALLEDFGDRLPEEGHPYLHKIHAEVRRMEGLIGDLLRLSRLTREPLAMDLVDLTSIAKALAQRERENAKDRAVNFVIESGLIARGDAGLLELALNNLLENAVKFTRDRKIARIEIGQTETQRGMAFFVRDNGVGFDLKYADRLFGPFQRLHPESDYPGTGLGLTTVQRVVHRHGGRIWAESEVKKGATFFFTLR